MSTAAPDPKPNQGKPIPRVEGRLKVTGQAVYAADMALPNLAHAALVTSTVARGTVRQLHLEAARAVPGVLDILSYGDADELKPPKYGDSAFTTLLPLSEPVIRHDGQIMALVVAETLEAAEEAARRVTAEYDLEPVSATLDSVSTETVPAVGNSDKIKHDPIVGDFEAAFRAAAVTLDEEYLTAPQHHNAMELFSSTAV